MKTLIACCLCCNKIHEVNNLKGWVYLAQSFRDLSVITQPHCIQASYNKAEHHAWEVVMEQSCSLHGIKDTKWFPATLIYLGENTDKDLRPSLFHKQERNHFDVDISRYNSV